MPQPEVSDLPVGEHCNDDVSIKKDVTIDNSKELDGEILEVIQDKHPKDQLGPKKDSTALELPGEQMKIVEKNQSKPSSPLPQCCPGTSPRIDSNTENINSETSSSKQADVHPTKKHEESAVKNIYYKYRRTKHVSTAYNRVYEALSKLSSTCDSIRNTTKLAPGIERKGNIFQIGKGNNESLDHSTSCVSDSEKSLSSVDKVGSVSGKRPVYSPRKSLQSKKDLNDRWKRDASEKSGYESPPKSDSDTRLSSASLRRRATLASIDARCKPKTSNSFPSSQLSSIRCIVCKESFTDRAELQRHATLRHPKVQILFCEFCSHSFLTHSGLKIHQEQICNAEKQKDKDEMEIVLIKKASESPRVKKRPARLESESVTTPKRSRRSMSEREPHSSSLRLNEARASKSEDEPKIQQSTDTPRGFIVKRKRGRPPKILLSSEKRYNYVESEVMSKSSEKLKKDLSSAEVRKLVVPISRLGGSALRKYDKSENEILEVPEELHVRNSRHNRDVKSVSSMEEAKQQRGELVVVDELSTRKALLKKRREGLQMTTNDRMSTRNSSRIAICEKSVESSENKDETKNESEVEKKIGEASSKDCACTESCEKVPSKEVGKTGEKINEQAEEKCVIRKITSDQNKIRAEVESEKSQDKQAIEARMLISVSKKIEGSELSEGSRVSETISEESACSEDHRQSQNNSENPSNPREDNDIDSRLDAPIEEFDPDQLDQTSIENPTESNSVPSKESVLISSNQLSTQTEAANKKNATEEPKASAENLKIINKDAQKPKNCIASAHKPAILKRSPVSTPVTRRTYSPSKKKPSVVVKTKKASPRDLCFMCKELFTLMKQLSGQFEGNKAKRISVQCPFCSIYFISMFYLEEHVAKFHLHCRSKMSCKQVRNVTTLKIPRDTTAIDCETEVNLALECHYCSAKFEDEKDLNNHVFSQHDLAISYEARNDKKPHYLNDLKNTCCQTRIRLLSIRSVTRIRKGDSLKVPSTSQHRFNPYSLAFLKKSKPRSSYLACSLCDSTFDNHYRYIAHIKTVHGSLNVSKSSKKPSHSPSRDTPTSHRTETRISSDKNSFADSEVRGEDQTNQDREYVLRQLLSDDSVDSFAMTDAEHSRKSSRERKSSEQEKTSQFECEICDKDLKTGEDLLIHSLEHDSNAYASSRERPGEPETEMNKIFADSLDESWADARLVDVEKTGTTKTTSRLNEEANSVDDIFASFVDNNDVSSATLSNDELGSDFGGSKRRKAKKAEKSTIGVQTGERGPSPLKKSTTESSQSNSVMKELLETEKELTKSVEDAPSPKCPIECGKCNRKFPNQALLNEHLFFLHDDNLKDTVLTDILIPSSQSNKGSKIIWRCKHCKHGFKMFQTFCRHRYFVHGDDDMVHICENCCKVLSSVTMVNVHICTDVAAFNCKTCNISFPTGMSLRLHNTDKHLETKGPHICVTCKKLFLTNAMLRRHEKWKHRLTRPSKSSEESQVEAVNAKGKRQSLEPLKSNNVQSSETKLSKIDSQIETEMDSGCDQEFAEPDCESAPQEIPHKRKRSSDSRDSVKTDERRKIRPRISPSLSKTDLSPAVTSNVNSEVMYVEEKDILRCSRCGLYCLSRETLKAHSAKCQSRLTEECRLCKQKYAEGKLLKHIIDRHINPCESYTFRASRKSSKSKENEKDAEELIRMLGTKRLVSLYEYHRYNELMKNGSLTCPSCTTDFDTSKAYQYHFLTNHDVMCALCNIEFKSGDKAANHKTEEHDSAGSYIWFAENTMKALTAETNFFQEAERSFMDMISYESDRSSISSLEDDDKDLLDDEEEDLLDEELQDKSEEVRQEDTTSSEESLEEEKEDKDDENVQEDWEEPDEDKIIIVVNEEDLKKYEIGSNNPNIWGLASKISSTSEELTPKDVKDVLETFFGR